MKLKVNDPTRLWRAHENDAGWDLRALHSGFVEPGHIKLVGTGLRIQVPPGYEAQIRPRSGLAAKHGISVVNAPGTIDAGFTGEIQVILVNLGPAAWAFEADARIAQLVVCPVVNVELIQVSEFDSTDRQAEGLGSTGV